MVTTGTRVYVTATLEVLVLPATSLATTVNTFAPALSVTSQWMVPPARIAGSPLHVASASPESPSLDAAVKVAAGVNSVAPLAGEVSESAGGVRSMLTDADAVDVLPA